MNWTIKKIQKSHNKHDKTKKQHSVKNGRNYTKLKSVNKNPSSPPRFSKISSINMSTNLSYL